ncbi:MAG: hypothetical protein ABJN69_17735 [Hellea sp.]
MWSHLKFFALTSSLTLAMTSISIAKEPPSPLSLLLQAQNTSLKSGSLNARNTPNIKEYRLDLKRDKVRLKDIEKSLTEAYGPPKTSRNNTLIWEIKNLTGKSGQSKQVTIMAGEENGAYFVTLDRRGAAAGNNPRHQRIKPSQVRVPQRQTIRNTSKLKPYERD